jgi:hypothetical protein
VGLLQHFEVAKVVKIGTEEIDIIFFLEILGKIHAGLSIITREG